MDGRVKAGGILHARGLFLVGVMSAPDRPGIAAAVFKALGEQRLSAQFIVLTIDLNQNAHVQFCVAAEDCERVVSCVRPIADALGAEKLITTGPVCLLSVYGPDFRERPGIAGIAFGALASAGINILAVSTSISTVTCVLDQVNYQRAVAALQSVFALP